jgi:hypothetical protein
MDVIVPLVTLTMDFRLLNSSHRESESKLPLHVTQHPPPTSEPSTRIKYSSASWISYPAWGHTIGSARVGPTVETETGYSFPGVAHAWTISAACRHSFARWGFGYWCTVFVYRRAIAYLHWGRVERMIVQGPMRVIATVCGVCFFLLLLGARVARVPGYVWILN